MGGVESVREAGWTQGSVLRIDGDVGVHGLEDGDAWMVVSHPCEVVSASLERDPTVQLIKLHVVDVLDGNLTFGKNPRRLQMELGTERIEVRVAEILTLNRTILTRTTPDLTIAEPQRRMLASWLAARYARPAFADEFNRRLEPARRGIEKILKATGKHISGIYVATTLEELPTGTPYRVAMAFTMTADDFDIPEVFAEVSSAGDEVAALIGSADGINLASLKTVSERDVSLAHLRIYARWDYESLSHRDSDEAVFPVIE